MTGFKTITPVFCATFKYYKLGLGIGWKQVRVMGFEGDDAVVEFAEDYEHKGKQMRGQVSKKPVADLREAVPQPLTRNEFINLSSGFTPEYLESIRERIEETRDPKVIADLINKAKKFFGDDFQVPGIPITGEQGPADGAEPPAWTGAPTDRIGDDPDRSAIKKINALIHERGYDRNGVKMAMREWTLHLKGEPAVKPFDVDSTNDIQLQHVMYFEQMLDDLQPHHNLKMRIDMTDSRVEGFADFVKDKMQRFANPIQYTHWYCLQPRTVDRIMMNLDDWAKELLELQQDNERF